MKPIRMEDELIELVEKRGKGKDFTDKVHNTLYTYFKEEENIKKRIKSLESKEQSLRETIAGLEKVRNMSGVIFNQVANLFSAIGRDNAYQIDSSVKSLVDSIEAIKKVM